MTRDTNRLSGFTIIELAVVIVVIGILVAITAVSYSGTQRKARDTQRESDIVIIAHALEAYYYDNGQYPPGSGSSSAVGFNASWSTTVDSSWDNLKAYLVPKYTSVLPIDPSNTPGVNPRTTGYGYAYYANGGSYCGVAARQMYIITYKLEASPRKDTFIGECTGTQYASSVSNYRVVK